MEWLHAARMGPLVAPALRCLGSSAAAFPRGAEGIRLFCVRIVESGDDDLETDALGALLGCLLIDAYDGAHRERNGKHWVQLGAHGFFDPFHTVTQVLESERPMEMLRAELARAHQEATHRAGIGRFVMELARVASLSGFAIQDHFASTLTLMRDEAEYEFDLTSSLKSVENEPDSSVSSVVAKLIESLQGNSDHALDESQIFPRLVPLTFFDEAYTHKLLRLEGDALTHQLSLALAGVSLSLVERSGKRLRFVRENEGDKPKLVHTAIDNLNRITPDILNLDVRHGAHALRRGDGLDAARVLLPRVREFARKQAEASVFAIPHRDQLYFSGQENDHLRTLVLDEHARAPHRISPALYAL